MRGGILGKGIQVTRELKKQKIVLGCNVFQDFRIQNYLQRTILLKIIVSLLWQARKKRMQNRLCRGFNRFHKIFPSHHCLSVLFSSTVCHLPNHHHTELQIFNQKRSVLRRLFLCLCTPYPLFPQSNYSLKTRMKKQRIRNRPPGPAFISERRQDREVVRADGERMFIESSILQEDGDTHS